MTGDVAGSWVEHVRAGGTTPWSRWVREAGGQSAPTSPATSSLPGAAQLELLRRLNELGPLHHRVDHVLGRPGPGRGPVHLRLPTDTLGPAAPRREVLRVAGGVLADLVVQLPPVDPRPHRPPRRSRTGRKVPDFVLDGLPVTVAEVRADLAEAGIVEQQPRRSRFAGPREPRLVVVVAGQLDRALHEAWAGRVLRGTARAWPRFVAQWSGRGRLPPSAEIDATVAYWSDRVGAGRVHLLALEEATDPLRAVLDVLGGPSEMVAGAGRVRDDDPVRLPPATLDALRRVNVVLPFVCRPEDRAARRTALLQLVRTDHGRPVRAWVPDLPAKERSWVATAARRVVDDLAVSGCVVHGDLGALRAVPPPTGRRVGTNEVLDAMVRMIHRVDAALLGESRDGRGGR